MFNAFGVGNKRFHGSVFLGTGETSYIQTSDRPLDLNPTLVG
uniref:Uncharacterized protein n=1 Tax=Anguilla anguilla TaxID=7936 RepID=A0A0E9TCI2_ANGAN